MNENELRESVCRAARSLKHCCEQINAFRAMENKKLKSIYQGKLYTESRLLENMGFDVYYHGINDDTDGKFYYTFVSVKYGEIGCTEVF